MLVEQLAGTLLTVAKDVKLQIEFNPAIIAAFVWPGTRTGFSKMPNSTMMRNREVISALD